MSGPLQPFVIDGIPCHPVTISEMHEEILRRRLDATARPFTIADINAHISNLARRDAQLRDDLQACDLVVADGMSVVWFGRWLGGNFRERCNQTDALFAWTALPDFPRSTALLVGGTAEQARVAAVALTRDCPHLDVLGSVDGYLDDEAILEQLDAAPATDFILVGLGSPRSERMLLQLAGAFPERIHWHIGGGTILHLADDVERAPAWMRRSGLQWFHRLCMEPRRMWKRYLLGNIAFIGAMVRQKFR